jgi:hypothetical protein
MKEAKDHKRISPQGVAMGLQMARLADNACAKLELEGEKDERCQSCAFRAGTVPNGCVQTQMDVLKAVVEGVPFLCHQHDRKGNPCHGWFSARWKLRQVEKLRGTPLQVSCPWEFSPPDEVKA